MLPYRVPRSAPPIGHTAVLTDFQALEAAGFDTAIHRSFEVPVDYDLSWGSPQQGNPSRYGFHGLSARAVAGQIRALAPHIYRAVSRSLTALAHPPARSRAGR